MKEVTLVFPNQLFENNPAIKADRPVYLIEEYLFFNHFRFHKQKITFHRATMKFYESYLQHQNISTEYIDAKNNLSDIREFISHLKQVGTTKIHFIEPFDNWLEKRIKNTAQKYQINYKEYSSPMFVNSIEELKNHFKHNSKLRQTNFYIEQRKTRNILIDSKGKPHGEKWTFDTENRKKYPKGKTPPPIEFPNSNKFYNEATKYTKVYFEDNPGEFNAMFIYPTTFDESKNWLKQFFETRFEEFGPYEDAMVAEEYVLNHSLLSPLLNSGLLTPQYIIKKTLEYTEKKSIPINSSEGFIRQIIGWREFIRGVYYFKGTEQRTRNFWSFNNKIPASFYDGTTGIEPLDIVIKKVIKSGYCHHIERLMVIGNFMLLCEFDPDEVYRWFMELFIDAYDWVMVPNVYGMSQFADGGLMATKPYISGSNYILKMSDFKKGDWQKIWDSLFWRFMHIHREFFLTNPRLGMLVRNFDKMTSQKQNDLLQTAEKFLKNLN